MKFWSILDLCYKHQLYESGIHKTYFRSDIQMNPETCAKSHQAMKSSALNNNLFF